MNFKNLKINENLIKGLNIIGIEEPTEIQKEVIPVALDGENLIGQS